MSARQHPQESATVQQNTMYQSAHHPMQMETTGTSSQVQAAYCASALCLLHINCHMRIGA